MCKGLFLIEGFCFKEEIRNAFSHGTGLGVNIFLLSCVLGFGIQPKSMRCINQ